MFRFQEVIIDGFSSVCCSDDKLIIKSNVGDIEVCKTCGQPTEFEED